MENIDMKRIANPIITEELCSYGCGNIAKYKNGCKRLMCQDHSSKCLAVRAKNKSGLLKAYKEGRRFGWNELRKRGLNTTWATGLTKYHDSRVHGKYDPGTVFTYNGKGPHKTILIIERGHKCERCYNELWQGQQIKLELDHINGDRFDARKENLILLCPNCHSLTPTWRGRNSNLGRKYVSDAELTAHLKEANYVINKALIKCGMTPKGANYKRCYDLIYNPGVC